MKAVAAKIGRNDPCPCRSGKKFKKCCLGAAESRGAEGTIPPPDVLHFAREMQRGGEEEKTRTARFGKVRPEIAAEFAGRTFVAVGSKLHYSEPNRKWITFPDFLLDYMAHVFGKEWGDAELKKPFADRHPVVQWRCKVIENIRKSLSGLNQVGSFTTNNLMIALNSFAYDLYTVDHNGHLDDFLLARLKNITEFEGARHELCAEATCIRAGFAIEHENQKDTSTRHAEFLAIHRTTGQKIAVEAKRRHRQPGKKIDFKFERLINDAVKKNSAEPLAIFLDTNLPTTVGERFFGQAEGCLAQPSKPMQNLLDRIKANYGGIDPYNLIIFTNHPHSLPTEDARAPVALAVSCISKIPRRHVDHEGALLELHEAARLYYNVPNELPQSGVPKLGLPPLLVAR
jgi:hypothetical protein